MTAETITITGTIVVQLSKDQADFVESQWQRHGYASRDDYFSDLLARMIRHEDAQQRSNPFDPDEHIPF